MHTVAERCCGAATAISPVLHSPPHDRLHCESDSGKLVPPGGRRRLRGHSRCRGPDLAASPCSIVRGTNSGLETEILRPGRCHALQPPGWNFFRAQIPRVMVRNGICTAKFKPWAWARRARARLCACVRVCVIVRSSDGAVEITERDKTETEKLTQFFGGACVQINHERKGKRTEGCEK